METTNPRDIARFWLRVNRRGKCWEHGGALDSAGYVQFYARGRWGVAHRWAYAFFYGPIPAGKHVCHACDNRRCVNPAHLWLGSAADNARDRETKGRGAGWKNAGAANPFSKLTAETVTEIRSRHATGNVTQGELASAFGVSQANISSILRGRTWKHL